MLSNVYQELVKLDDEKTDSLIFKKRAKDPNRHRTKEDVKNKQAHETILSLIRHQGNANDNNNELLFMPN